MKSYFLTYTRLTKMEPLTAMGYHQGEGGELNFCVRGSPPRVTAAGLALIIIHTHILQCESKTGTSCLTQPRISRDLRGQLSPLEALVEGRRGE